MAIRHTSGEKFTPKQYTNDQLTEMMREIAQDETNIIFDMRTFKRLEDLNLNPLEIERALQQGYVIESEVSMPSKWEIRLNVCSDNGDMVNFEAVAWLSKELQLHCTDARERREKHGR